MMLWLPDQLCELAISQVGRREVSFSLAHLYVTLSYVIRNCRCSQSRRLAPFLGWGVFIPKCIGFLPVGVSADTAVFSVLALCLYLGQAYFNSAGTSAGLRLPSGADTEEYWVGSDGLGS